MELSPDMHQDLPNFWEYENPHFFFISCYDLFFPCMNALAFVDIAQGIHSFNEKNKINTRMKRFSRQT